jgi:hypothetical protein
MVVGWCGLVIKYIVVWCGYRAVLTPLAGLALGVGPALEALAAIEGEEEQGKRDSKRLRLTRPTLFPTFALGWGGGADGAERGVGGGGAGGMEWGIGGGEARGDRLAAGATDVRQKEEGARRRSDLPDRGSGSPRMRGRPMVLSFPPMRQERP